MHPVPESQSRPLVGRGTRFNIWGNWYETCLLSTIYGGRRVVGGDLGGAAGLQRRVVVLVEAEGAGRRRDRPRTGDDAGPSAR